MTRTATPLRRPRARSCFESDRVTCRVAVLRTRRLPVLEEGEVVARLIVHVELCGRFRKFLTMDRVLP